MGFNRAEEQDRQRRLRGGGERPTNQPARDEVPAVYPSWIPIVLRSVQPALEKMYFHKLGYADSPPVVGNYTTYGNLERGYPLPTLGYGQYAAYVWPETRLENGVQVPNPITTETVPLLATRDKGYWIVMVPLKDNLATAGGTYVFGGVASACAIREPIENNDLYAPDRWMTRTPLICPARQEAAGVTIDGAVYSFGGQAGGGGTALGRICDTTQYIPDAWRAMTDMPLPARSKAGAFSLDGKGYVSGGSTQAVEPGLTDFDEFTPASNTWRQVPTPVPEPRWNHAAFAIDNVGYVVGGHGSGGPFRDTFVYRAENWSGGAPLPLPQRHAHRAFVIGGLGYVAGGEFGGCLQDLDEFNPSGSGTWRARRTMLAPGRRDHTAGAIGGSGFIHGGKGSIGPELANTDEYTPDGGDGNWSIKTPMPLPPRQSAAAATL